MGEGFENIMLAQSKALRETASNIRRELHKVPELGFELEKTRQLVKHYLKAFGVRKIEDCGDGILALIEAEDPNGPVIGLRADMDAMPGEEATGLHFSSQHKGRMHSCGHDGHMANLLITAKLLMENLEKWRGQVKLIFQPAEESVSGAKQMIKNGALEDPKVDKIFGLHIWQPLETGTIGIKSGPLMASTDNFKIELTGRAAHAATPHQGIDAISAGCDFVNKVQTILTRVIPNKERYVLTFGKINGGDAFNAVAETVTLEGVFRSFNNEIRKKGNEQIQLNLEAISKTYGVRWCYEVMNEASPLINHNQMTEVVKNAASKVISPTDIKEIDPVTPAEDFAEYLNAIPGAYFFLGGGGEGYTYSHHHSKFDFNEEALTIGPAIFTQIVLELT